jgi:integrase
VNHAPSGFQPATVNEIYAKLTELYQHKGRSPETWRNLKSKLVNFLKGFGARRLDSIRVEELEKWAHGLPGGARYRKNILDAVVTLQRQAQRWKHLPPGEPSAVLVARPSLTRSLPPILTVQQTADALACLSEHNPSLLPYFVLGAFAGLRPSELCRGHKHADTLRWPDVQFASGHIWMRGEVVGKTGEPRFVPMEDNLVAWLRPFAKSGNDRVCKRHDVSRCTALLREKKIISQWPKDVLRHSYGTYHHALYQNLGQLASNMGNSEAVIRKSYRQPRPQAEGKLYFSLFPKLQGVTIPFKQNKTSAGDNHLEKEKKTEVSTR